MFSYTLHVFCYPDNHPSKHFKNNDYYFHIAAVFSSLERNKHVIRRQLTYYTF